MVAKNVWSDNSHEAMCCKSHKNKVNRLKLSILWRDDSPLEWMLPGKYVQTFDLNDLLNRHHNIIDIWLNSRFQILTIRIRDINRWQSATSRHRTQTDARSAETSCSVSGVWSAFVRREVMYIMSGHAGQAPVPATLSPWEHWSSHWLSSWCSLMCWLLETRTLTAPSVFSKRRRRRWKTK